MTWTPEGVTCDGCGGPICFYSERDLRGPVICHECSLKDDFDNE